jgi:MFS transporter, CP family, cyanate transporter
MGPAAATREATPRPARHPAVLVLAVLLVAVNLRAGIAAVSPLLADIRDDFGIGRGTAGLLTTVPVVCFGLLSPVAVLLGRRLGSERALLIGVAGIAAGSALRGVPVLAVTFVGTALIGASITLGNVLLPTVVKEEFGSRSGTVTGLYTAAMTGGAAVAAAVSAPIASAAGGDGWQVALAVWAVPALLAAVVWAPRAVRGGRVEPPPAGEVPPARVRDSSVTWALVLFMALQAGVFYALLAWLPAILRDHGASVGGAGLALSLFNLAGIPAAVAVPVLASRRPAQFGVAVPLVVGWLFTVGGLLLAPGLYLLWATVGGLVQGGGIGLLLMLFVLRTSGPRTARALSGTVQGIGYLVGSTGPFLFGAARDATGSWTAPLAVMLVVVIVMCAGMLWACQDRHVA